MFKKVSLLLSSLICILLYQNCGLSGFESNFESLDSNFASEESSSQFPFEVADEPTIMEPTPTTPPEVKETDLQFSNLNASLDDQNRIVINWNQSTPGTGQVFFGLTEKELINKTDKENNDLSSHKQIIRVKLEVNTRYYFRVTSFIGGNSYNSEIISINYEPKEIMPEQREIQSVARGDIAQHCDETKPLCGIMYGVAISGETYGHTRQFKNAGTIRFQSEKNGFVESFTYHNRVYIKSEWESDDGKGYNTKFKCKNSDTNCKMKKMKSGGYHMGNGGLLSFTMHADDGTGKPAAKTLAIGTTKIVPTKNHNYVGTYEGVKCYTGNTSYDVIKWNKPVKVELGKYYHLVTNQEEPEKGSVVMNGFYAHHPGTKAGSAPGGPYYGRRYSVYTRNSATDSWRPRLNVFPDYKLHYSDGTTAGPGNDGVGGQYPRYKVKGQKMMRQVFTKDYNAQMSGIWVRLNRINGNDPLIITVKESGGALLTKVSSPASKVPKTYSSPVQGPVNWVFNKFTSPINLIKGRKYFVDFQTSSSTTYQLQTEETYDYRGGIKLSKESVWRGAEDRAEFSDSGINGFKPVPRSVKDLSILFTVNGKPEVIE